MTNKDLLTLAAKAAGIELNWPTLPYSTGDETPNILGEWQDWNPTNDDGDALRLAVKLRMCVDVKPEGSVHSASVFVGFGALVRGGGRNGQVGAKAEDIGAAARRAIVQAAAAIGKALP